MINRLKIAVVLLFCSLSSGSAVAAGLHANGASHRQTMSTTARLVKVPSMLDGKMNHYRSAKTVPVGVWGGRDIQLDMSKDGATVEYACAHGSIHGRILLDRSGRFSVAGTHFRDGPGPIRVDQERGEQVLFKGKVTGQKMELTVTRKDTKEVLGTFTLTHGQSSAIRKCK